MKTLIGEKVFSYKNACCFKALKIPSVEPS